MHWSVFAETAPDGMTLSDSGILSGNPSRGGIVRVQAQDNVSTVRRLLVVIVVNPLDVPVSLGVPLPDGSRLSLLDSSTVCTTACAPWYGTYRADGSIDALETASIAAVREFEGPEGHISPDGSLYVDIRSDENGEVTAIEALDAVTGETLASVPPLPGVYGLTAHFSPDGEYLLIQAEDDEAQVYDTDSGDLVRTITADWEIANIIWSSGSDELAWTMVEDGPIQVAVVADDTGASDRAVDVPGCFSPVDWSVGDRLLLSCGPDSLVGQGVITVSAVDGSDARLVAEDLCCEPFVINSPIGFSPDGDHIAILEQRVETFGDPTCRHVGYVGDVDHGPFVAIASPAPVGYALIFGRLWG